ncbi:MAG: galactose-1-phosphate uridylyltransferase, partial [Lachnospiraceae bacterium]|nr:galactose-1-phosphate uridylyltransferase [Lachnospiraceae bacterium]
MIQKMICELTAYGLSTGLIKPEDKIYTVNRLLELFGLDEWDEAEEAEEKTTMFAGLEMDLERILNGMLDYAVEQGLIAEDTITYRDLFDTKIMSVLMPRPSEVCAEFKRIYTEQGEKAATDYYYKLSGDSNYIRRARVAKDMKWTTETEFGTLDITINLSKPEKDPKAIAAAKLAKQSGYPKCLLCKENEGY